MNSHSSQAQMPPLISVIIPCRNEAHTIEGVVNSILNQIRPDGDFEIVLADGMSDDGTREILQALSAANSRIRLIDNPGKIVSTGLNAAIRQARGSIIVRMDAHTKYAPDYIVECCRTLTETGADNVGGPWIAVGQNYRERVIAAAFQSPFAAGGARGHDPIYEGPVDTVYLGCWRRAAFERFGLFDEQLVRNQDDELNLRITRAGGRIVQSPRIRSAYRPRGSYSRLFAQYKQYGFWKVRVIQKHRIPASWRHLVPGAFVLSWLGLFALMLAGALFRAPETNSDGLSGYGLFPWAAWSLLGLSSVYAASNVVASVLTARRSGWSLLPGLPFAFGAFHLGYGWGFLVGVANFLILRRSPTSAYTTLTRDTGRPVS